MWVKKIAARIGLLSFGFVLGFLLLEVLVRVLYPQSAVFRQRNEFFGQSHVPNLRGWSIGREFKVWTEINSKGLRDVEHDYKKPPGVFRILILGDSFAEALQVPLEDSFPRQIEALLNQKAERNIRFEVINTGVSGFGTDNELLFFRHEGYKYEPDLVLLAFMTNDVRNNDYRLEGSGAWGMGKPYFVLHEGELELRNFPHRPSQSWLHPVASFIYRRSQIFRLGWDAIPRVRATVRSENTQTLDEFQDSEGHIPPDYRLFDTEYPPELDEAWSLTKALIAQLGREVEATGARLVVVSCPMREQVSQEWGQETLDAYPAMMNRQWDLDNPDRILVEFLEENGLPYVTLLPRFRAHYQQSGPDLYFHYDGHWTTEGHRLAGQVISEYLVEQGLVPTFR